MGLAKFFLSIGLPGSAKDLYYQIDALACLENNRQVIPKIFLIRPFHGLYLCCDTPFFWNVGRVGSVLGTILMFSFVQTFGTETCFQEFLF